MIDTCFFNGTRFKQTHVSYRTSPNKRFCQRSTDILDLSHQAAAERQVFDPITYSVLRHRVEGRDISHAMLTNKKNDLLYFVHTIHERRTDRCVTRTHMKAC